MALEFIGNLSRIPLQSASLTKEEQAFVLCMGIPHLVSNHLSINHNFESVLIMWLLGDLVIVVQIKNALQVLVSISYSFSFI